mgnify:CR=1 FL=1
MSRATNMTVGRPTKLILGLAVPLILTNVGQQLYTVADASIVGRGVGVEALAALGATDWLYWLVLWTVQAMTQGFSVLVSQTFGSNDKKGLRKAITMSVLLCAAVGILLTVAFVSSAGWLLHLLDTPENIYDGAHIYLTMMYAGTLITMAYNMAAAILRALGDGKSPLIAMFTAGCLNIVLDLLFIGAFHWGVWSAAVATTISQAVSMILCMIHLMKKGTIYQVELKKLHIDREMLGQIIRYGLPSGVQNSVIGFANVIVQSNINSFGKVAMAAYGAYSKLEGFAFLPVTSFTMALTTFVGQNLGAGLHDRAKKGSRFGIIASVVIAEIIGVTMYLLAPQLVALFSPTPEVVELGTRQMRTTALFFCLLAYSHAIASICRGAGKAFVPMVIMLLFWCVVRIAYITIVMGIVHEIQYIYMAYPITWSLSSIVYFLYYHFSDWVHGFDKKPAKPQET